MTATMPTDAPSQSGLSKGRLVALLVVLTSAILWSTWTVINAVRLGVRGSDPGIYWTSTVIIALITGGLVWLARRVYRRLRSLP